MTIEEYLEEVEPDVARIIEGLRDTGYSFEAAVCDIIDNSIAAEAVYINISATLDHKSQILIRISDDGFGMTKAGLTNAMKYGSEERTDPHSLGRFGLGLKTASTSFCRRLTVMSKPSSGEQTLNVATWDLDLVAERGKWLLQNSPASQSLSDEFNENLNDLVRLGSKSKTGTVVVWDKVDRLLQKKQGGPYQYPDRELTKRLNALRGHIAMVFQRFLDTADKRARNVTIAINGDVVGPWDPFGESFQMEPIQPAKTMALIDDDGVEYGDIVLRAFILPHEDEVDNPQYKQTIGFSNTKQGFYVYRENRLIELPTWFGFVVNEPHWNRLRIELSFPAPADPFFGVGIKKSGLHLDAGLAIFFQNYCDPLRREAQRMHRSGSAKKKAQQNTGSRPTELVIGRATDLQRPRVTKDDDGSIAIENEWKEQLDVVLPGGQPNPVFRTLINDATPELAVVMKETLEDGVLWQPMVNRTGHGTAVAINVSHDWYRKAYLPYASDNTLAQAIEFLLFALSEAEYSNTAPELQERFDEFRVLVSRNLRKLVRDLPEYVEPES